MIETIKTTLNNNENITNEVKENLLELITIFNNNFKDIDLANLNERLKTLIIKRESMFLVKLPCKYNPYTNELLINLGLFENCDAKHWLMHALLGMITAKDNYYGFNNEENTLVALNEGYTEIITNNLVGDVENNFFTDEIIMTNLISKAIGEDTMYNAYFGNDSKSIVRAMIEAEVSKMEKIQKFIDDLNNDLKNRKRGLPTNPIEKQQTFARLYPSVAAKHTEYFCLNENYYPESTRGSIDVQNIEVARMEIEEIKNANTYKQDMSMHKAA